MDILHRKAGNYCPSPRWCFHRSGAAEKWNAAAQGNLPGKTNRDIFTLHNHRHLLPAARQGNQLLQFLGIFIHVHENGAIPVGFPCLVAEGSGIGAVNDDFVRHDSFPPISRKLFHCATHLPLPHQNGTVVGRRPLWS